MQVITRGKCHLLSDCGPFYTANARAQRLLAPHLFKSEVHELGINRLRSRKTVGARVGSFTREFGSRPELPWKDLHGWRSSFVQGVEKILRERKQKLKSLASELKK